MSNVTAAKPQVGGGIWMAPTGSTLPTDASTALAAAFKSLGYVDENGVTRAISLDTQTVKAWGGAVVAVLQNGKTETFRFRLLEPDNLDVLGLTFGEASGTLANGITVKSTRPEEKPQSFVISMLEANNVHHRIVIPQGVVTNIGEIQYVDNAVEGFELTITAIEDASGNTAYDYLKTVTPSSNG